MGVTYIKRRGDTAPTDATSKQDNSVVLSKAIYDKLSNYTENKNLTTPTEPKTEYEEWLLDMNELSEAIRNGDTSGIKEGLIEADRYLGRLGLDEQYPFSDSSYESPSWISLEDRADYRVMSDGLEILSDGEDILISIN